MRRGKTLAILAALLAVAGLPAAIAGLITAAGPKLYISSSPVSCDYYASTTGTDSNNGLTQGTAWAITSVWTKASTYATKTLCIADGTYTPYNGSTVNFWDAALYVPATAAGTSTNRTVIRALNDRAAIIDGTGGGSGGNTAAGSVVGVVADYVTIYGFELRNAALRIVDVSSDNVRVEHNYIHGVSSVAYTGSAQCGNNSAGIHTDDGADSLYAGNNYITAINCGSASNNEVGIELYDGTNAVLEYNEIEGSAGEDPQMGIFFKDNDNGAVARYNWIHGVGTAFFFNTNNASYFSVYHNVAADFYSSAYNRDTFAEAATTNVYGNTFVVNHAVGQNVYVYASSGNAVNFHDNLLVRGPGGSISGYADMVSAGASGFGTLDYNMYPASGTFNLPAGTSRTFSAWKSTTGKDANAIQANPTFASGGSGPYAYKLDPASSGIGAGTGGINIGAFPSSGQNEQRGPSWRNN